MKVIEELNLYNQFVQTQVFDKLYSQVIAQKASASTYQFQTHQTFNGINAQLILLYDQRPSWRSFQGQYNVYLSTFESMRNLLNNQLSLTVECSTQLDLIAELLEQNHQAWQHIQDKLIEQSFSELNRWGGKIKAEEHDIAVQMKQIEACQSQCFSKMIQFARELSEVSIKVKFNFENDIEVIQQYGSKCSEMNSYLYDTIPDLQGTITQKYDKIRQYSHKIQAYLGKVVNAFYKAQQGKISILEEINHILQPQDNKPIELIPIKYQLQQPKGVQICEFSPMKHMKKTVDLTLHPHSRNQTILSHRESLASLCSRMQESGMRSDRVVVVDLEEQGQQMPETEILKQLCAIINDHFNRIEELSAFQLEDFYEYLKTSFRSAKERELFLFILYNKIKDRLQPLNRAKQSVYLGSMNLCLRKCMDCYDSQTIIKLILLALKIRSDDPNSQFFEKLDLGVFVDNFQFWESTFIENVFEYVEIMVNFYHLQLDHLKQQHAAAAAAQSSFWDIINPIKNLFRLGPIHEHRPTSIKDLFPEILKNAFTIYLSLMKVLHAPEKLQTKLKQRIVAAFERLGLTVEETDYLHDKLAKLNTRSEPSLKALLRNDIILERALTKILGSGEQKGEEDVQGSTLSKSIREWEGSP